MKTGYEKSLNEYDLYNPLSDQESHILTEELDRLVTNKNLFNFRQIFMVRLYLSTFREWQKELKNSSSPSLPRTLMRIHARRFLLWNMLMILEVIYFFNIMVESQELI